MSAAAPNGPRIGFGPMLPAMALVQVAKRLGLAKPVLRVAFARMFSRRLKQRAFAGYRPTRHDVFVATFGKSGTNWMMQIAQQIAWRGAAEFAHIHDVVPWPDAPAPMPVRLADASAAAASPTGLRVIKTHLEPEFVPYAEQATYLTCLRDPKEVAVSSWFFLGGLFGVLRYLSIDDWCELFLADGGMAETWAAHAAGFWSWRGRENVLVLNYRDVLREPDDAIERVAAVMGVKLAEPEREAVARRSSFEYMQRNESRFAPPRTPLTKAADHPKMVRRGRSGASDELLSRAWQARIDCACQAALQRLGSDLPYASWFDVVAGDAA